MQGHAAAVAPQRRGRSSAGFGSYDELPDVAPGWPPLSAPDVLRVNQLFQTTDTDHDGWVTGGEGVAVLSRYGLPQETLMQVSCTCKQASHERECPKSDPTQWGVPEPLTLSCSS